MNKLLKIKEISPFQINKDLKFTGAKAYYVEKKNTVFLRSIHGTSLLLSHELLDEIKNNNICKKLILLLKSRGFINEFTRFDVRNHKPLPHFFMIDFTTKCNMKCYYCLRNFHEDGETITQEQLNNILNYISSYCKENNISSISIQPWGGEPLIALDKILYMQDYFVNKNINVQISVQTNGLLLNDEICQTLKRRNISVGVSIDGCKIIQNKQRKDVSNDDTYDRILKNIHILKKYYGNNFGSISVNTRFGLPYIEESLHSFAKDVGLKSIKMNLMHPNCIDFDMSSVISEQEIDDFITRILKTLIDLNKEGYKIFDSNIRDKIKNLLYGKCSELCHSDGCTGGFSSVTFARNGDIYPCELVGNEKIKLGSIYDGVPLSDMISLNLKKNIYFHEKKKTKCEKCDWFTHCRGGCTASCLSYNRKLGDVDEIECTINNVLYPKLIELILTDKEAINFLSNSEIRIVK